jgi:hypothetical protein
LNTNSEFAPRSAKKRLATIAGCIGILILFVALRWNNYDAPLIRDEGEYAYSAQLLRSGQLPYEHAFLQKPPMVAYSYLVANLLAPRLFWSPRLVAYLFTALMTVLLGRAARNDFGPEVAWTTMWIVTPMVLLPNLSQFPANSEMFMLLPVMAMISLRYRNSGAAWFAGGAIAVATILYKYTALALLALIFAAWSLRYWKNQRNFRQLFARWMLALLGAALATTILLGPFLISDGGKRFWECTVAFNRWYAKSETFGWTVAWLHVHTLWESWWILFFLPLFVFVKLRPGLGFWIAAFGAAWLTTAASQYEHYYITVMPFWALLAGLGVRNLSNWINAKFPTKFAHWVGPALTVIVVGALCLPDASWILRSKQQFALDKWGPGSPFVASPVVARRVAELTSLNDKVCVAGSEPQILYYAQRFSPTRFVISYPLTMSTPLARTFQLEAISDLEAKPPAVIVLVRSPESWETYEETPTDYTEYLKKIVSENYELIGGYLVEKNADHWQEPLGSDEMLRTNLVVFKRKGQ